MFTLALKPTVTPGSTGAALARDFVMSPRSFPPKSLFLSKRPSSSIPRVILLTRGGVENGAARHIILILPLFS